MKSIVQIILTSLILTSCNLFYKAPITGLDNFDKKMIDHFPKNDTNLILKYQESSNYNYDIKNYGQWYKEMYLYKTDSLINIESFKSKSQIIIKDFDNCLIILPIRYKGNIDIGKVNITPCADSQNFIPIPNFTKFIEMDFLKDENLIDKLPSDFTFYILDTKKGLYFEEKDLIAPNLMPENWSNGFSKGIAISEQRKMIIYWIDVW